MNKIESTKKYKVPQIIDISGNIAIGDSTSGFCMVGSNPSTTSCKDGSSPIGNPPEDCSPVGSLPEWGKCLVGSNVAHGCVSGSAVLDT
jgi:hypothetical protein